MCTIQSGDSVRVKGAASTVIIDCVVIDCVMIGCVVIDCHSPLCGDGLCGDRLRRDHSALCCFAVGVDALQQKQGLHSAVFCNSASATRTMSPPRIVHLPIS